MAPLAAYISAGLIVVLLIAIVAELQTLREYVGSLSTGHDAVAELRQLGERLDELVQYEAERASTNRLAKERHDREHPYVVPPYVPERQG